MELKNFFARVASSAVLVPIVLYCTLAGSYPFLIMMLLAAILMAFEWNSITSINKKNATFWKLAGICYILFPTISLIWLRNKAEGLEIVIWIFMIVWGTDISAYIGGSFIGGPKLAPKISPNKTWSGLLVGILASGTIGYLVGDHFHSAHPNALIVVSAVLAVYAQAGDLIESWIKRKFNVKDSGHLIPGHGGIMDRVDGIVAVAPKVAFMVLVEGGSIF